MPCHGIIGDITEVHRSARELCLEWRLHRFLHLVDFDYFYYDSPPPSTYYESSRFAFYDACWNLSVYPDWKKSGWVTFTLNRLDTDTSTKTVKAAISIMVSGGVENRIEEELKFENDDCWFLDDSVSRSELSDEEHRLMPGNVLTIVCEMEILGTIARVSSSTQTVEESKEAEAQTEENHSLEKQGVEELQKSFQRLLGRREGSDVVIKVKGKEFRAHRLILRSRSSVLQAMFTHNKAEKQSGVVIMKDCDPESFLAFLEHIYTGSTRMISTQNVFSLYKAADNYDLSALKEACTEFIKHNLTVSCFCDAITLAVNHGEKELINHATEFFCGNSLDICETVEWEIFLKENSSVAKNLLKMAFSK